MEHYYWNIYLNKYLDLPSRSLFVSGFELHFYDVEKVDNFSQYNFKNTYQSVVTQIHFEKTNTIIERKIIKRNYLSN